MLALGLGSLALLADVTVADVWYDGWEVTYLPLRAAVALFGVALLWRIHRDTGSWQFNSELVAFATCALVAITVITQDQMLHSLGYGHIDFFRGLHVMTCGLLAFVAFPIPFRWRVALCGSYVAMWILLCIVNDDPATMLVALFLLVVAGYAASLVRHVNTLQRRTHIAARSEQYQRQLVERATEDLRQAQRQLLLREKMASVGGLTAGVAHEISNPANFAHAGAQVVEGRLAALRGFLLELADDAGDDVKRAIARRVDELQAQLATVLQGTRRIRELVTGLKAFSRRPGDLAMLDIGDAVERAAATVQAKFEGFVLVQSGLDFRPTIECQPAQIEQAMLHLLDNACEAVVRRQVRVAGPGTVTIRSRFVEDALEISVEDTGCGMPEEILDRVFEPFFTTKTVGEGAGLGLSVAFEIAKRHGGSISLMSEEGAGTCATLRLPLPRSGDARVQPRLAAA